MKNKENFEPIGNKRVPKVKKENYSDKKYNKPRCGSKDKF